MTAPRFSPNVEEALRRMGWAPGRSCDAQVREWDAMIQSAGGRAMPPAVRKALLEFGGLKLIEQGAGEECARNPIDLDPALWAASQDFFQELERDHARAFWPLGESGPMAEALAIDDSGRVYDTFEKPTLLGEDIDEALERLIRGIDEPTRGPGGWSRSCRRRACAQYRIPKPDGGFCTKCGQRLL